MLANYAMLLAQGAEGAVDVEIGAGPSPLLLLIYCIVLGVGIAGMWKTFTKAGKPGWAAIVPIYNAFVAVEISGRPILWFILLLVPCVQFVAAIIVGIDFAAKFGKSQGFGVGLGLLWFIFFPILGFGSAQYQGGGAPARY